MTTQMESGQPAHEHAFSEDGFCACGVVAYADGAGGAYVVAPDSYTCRYEVPTCPLCRIALGLHPYRSEPL